MNNKVKGDSLDESDLNVLLCCPFCGSKVVEELVNWNLAQAKCSGCKESWGTCGSRFDGRYDKWNKRVN